MGRMEVMVEVGVDMPDGYQQAFKLYDRFFFFLSLHLSLCLWRQRKEEEGEGGVREEEVQSLCDHRFTLPPRRNPAPLAATAS